ncbi:MAG: glutamyl-tRNA reductase, partial [Syntrophorhabdaceae bacterium]|nr:glutamyl-tRNA reductase [Syntrophorhabdaceae bacterium]
RCEFSVEGQPHVHIDMKRQAIGIIGLNHNTAPLEIREKLYIKEGSIPELLAKIKREGINEAVVISTCNRTEIYYCGDDNDEMVRKVRRVLADAVAAKDDWFDRYMYIFTDEEAFRHLFLVASGLDSMVIGEPEIFGQVKEAYRIAASARTTGFFLNKTFHKSFNVAKRIRSETRIGYNPLSISSMAVELARRIFGNLDGKKILVVGAGEMCETALKYFQKEGLSDIFITNRTYQKAHKLADEIIGEARPFEALFELLTVVDVVLTSTGSDAPLIGLDMLHMAMKKRKNRPLFFIDIAVPRDVDPAVNDMDNVYLYDIDDLKELSQRHLSNRVKESEKAHVIIEEEATKFSDLLEKIDINPLIGHIMATADSIRSGEIKKTMARLANKDPELADTIDAMTRSIVNKLVHPYLALLKDNQDPAVFDTLKKLFQFEDDDENEMDSGDERV